MDYQTFPSRHAAREEASAMRRTGWPRAVVDRVLIPADDGDGRDVWIVCATGHRRTTCLYLRADGYVR